MTPQTYYWAALALVGLVGIVVSSPGPRDIITPTREGWFALSAITALLGCLGTVRSLWGI